MDWLYVWSPRYRFFHEVLSACGRDLSGFTITPVFAEQHLFTPRTDSAHFLTGIPIKLHVIRSYIQENMGKTFFFSDVDLVVFPSFSLQILEPYRSNAITTMREPHPTVKHNIGCLLIQCTPETLAFFERVLTRTRNEMLLDQDAFNEEVASFPGQIGLFDETQMCQSNVASERDPQTLKIVQCLTSETDPTKILVEKALTLSQYVDCQAFRRFLPEPVLQELDAELRSCQS